MEAIKDPEIEKIEETEEIEETLPNEVGVRMPKEKARPPPKKTFNQPREVARTRIYQSFSIQWRLPNETARGDRASQES